MLLTISPYVAALCLALGYLLGSIPFGLLLTRAAGTKDLRSIGSGNIGATNVLRTGRKGLAAATLLLDMGKGAGAVLAGGLVGAGSDNGLEGLVLGGLGALIGHCYPVWLKFRGGKGVATMLGVSFGLDWRIGLASALTWAVVRLETSAAVRAAIWAVLTPASVAVVSAVMPAVPRPTSAAPHRPKMVAAVIAGATMTVVERVGRPSSWRA